MKTKINPLHSKAAARIPNRTASSLTFNGVPPMAVKLLLYLAYQWDQEKRRAPVRKRSALEEVVLSASFQELGAHLAPETKGIRERWDYRTLKAAIDALTAVKLRKSINVGAHGKQMHHWVTLVSEVLVDEETSRIQFFLPSSFQSALRILEMEGFTLVPLADALALRDTRHLRMFMWGCTFQHLTHDAQREVSVGRLREALGLTAASYDNWPEVWAKLKSYTAAITDSTGYRLQLTPVKAGRKVEAVRFDMERKKRNR